MRVRKELKAIQEKIDKLEEHGWKVSLAHDPAEWFDYNGLTEMCATKDNKIFVGSAICGHGDNFSKTTGTVIAFGRMMKNMSASLGRHKMLKIFQ